MCAALGVSRSGYYEWCDRRPSRRAEDNQRLLQRIREVHRASRENYGAHKTWKALRAEGESCGENRVARLRQTHGIVAKRVVLFRRAYANRNSAPPAPNSTLAARAFRSACRCSSAASACTGSRSASRC